jgi:LacI family transcriptional regulator
MSQRREDEVPGGPPTIREIASRTGVSVATVSRVINGRPDVAAATREVVMKAIRERDYVTNRSARGLAGGRTGFIGLTVPFVHAEYFMQMVSGAATALYERDARFVMCPTEHEHDREVSVLERLMHGTTDGAVLVLPSESSDELARLQRRQYPFVVMDPLERLDDGIPVVTAAHWSGARAVTEYLISLGHRRIGVITGPINGVATIDRLGGYHAALLAAGLPAPPQLIVYGEFQVESGARGAAELLALPERPTAIFAFNDNMAIGALDTIRANGLRVPEDISLVGFDDTQISSVTLPKLTTVRQPLQEMGRVAASILFRLIDGQPLEVSRMELSTRLVVRDSTAPPSH